ncbi:hypothetical protein F5Y16DRAFT_419327 [Xylariaceae sp. FL0255]|nr:hypothetical protein F5Y16DRAFT_419327 [Xylariaceae sp. FL0255]
MSGSSTALQYQFDVLAGAVASMQLVRTLLRLCQDEDLQPFTISSLESFGNWLSVDSARLNQGEYALAAALKPGNIFEFANKVIIGDKGIVNAVRNNIHLTAAFLFVAACTTLSPPQIAELIHELLRLTGAVNRNAEFRGYRDYIPGDTPFEVYTALANSTTGSDVSSCRGNEGLDHHLDATNTAKFLYEVFTALADISIKQIVVRGNRGGLWIASLLSWLRPREVVAFGPGKQQLYPRAALTDPGQLRVWIVLEAREAESSADPEWLIERWMVMSEENMKQSSFRFPDGAPDSLHIRDPTYYPLKSVKCRISSKVSGSEIEAFGILASAIVIMATEQGTLSVRQAASFWDEHITLKMVCAEQFLSSYITIITRFGWDKVFDEEVAETVKAIEDQFEQAIVPSAIQLDDGGHSSVKFFVPKSDTLYDVILRASEKQQFPQRCRVDEIWCDTWRWSKDVVTYAIKVAEIALAMSVCLNIPGNAQCRLRDFPSQLRRQAVEFLLSEPIETELSDLAISSHGYIIYTLLMTNDQWCSTQRRIAASVSIMPGTLRLRDMSTTFRRLKDGRVYAQDFRIYQGNSSPVQLHDTQGEFQPLEDDDARSDGRAVIEHLIQIMDDSLVVASVIVAPNLYTAPNSLKEAFINIPVSWKDSIWAILSATHIDHDTTRQSQLEELAKEWIVSGTFESTSLRWRSVGDVDDWPKRSIVRTAGKGTEAIRFFEAGRPVMRDGEVLRLGFDLIHIFIRHGPVSLGHCLKEAMQYQQRKCWVIIT